ncbi:MAG: TonB family protein [Endozoicomonas sp.]|uniref:TonB family protein n=1 Tax=Endozoicomonas sp. TaxID=1892382 RepID=UPI003D9B4EFE
MISLGLGFAVALGLFAVMNALVNSNRHELVNADDTRISEFIRLQRPETIKEKKREIPKPQPKKPPPPPEMKISQQVDKPVIEQVKMDIPKMDVDLDLAVGNGAGSFASSGRTSDGGPVPLNQFNAGYPRKALQKGQTGLVIMTYRVNPQGRVVDLKILKEKPRGYGFAKFVKKAAAKWKFKPATQDGKPVMSKVFELPYEFNLD